ncbi:alpha/beta fold hydrolase [Jiulongibacter sediminis]|uniref:AB hydrolase-1 domain-containing protein n=1 Tax=Jiulongibacter sediminis TaxID=1605367 RepID=A0A0P7BB27_9BACT|nr:alpha/beta hydrolase [Jiulongibacter sediminis]KPM47662.1 hypothetical protein AFM12_14405 [Jiulongibacter sediminis]TBX23454.1 hypothetical protein TK44_14415 [Jiulongibacter sediminis]
MKRLNYLALMAILPLLFSCEKFKVDSQENSFFYIKNKGAELPVWVRGNTTSKKFIIYINGGPGATSLDIARADMFGWSEGLETNFAMVYYDQRGCGNAQGNINDNTLTIKQYVEDLDQIITVLAEQYDQPKIYLMGASFGGFIGANYLLTDQFQQKISGWISVDGAYNFDYDLSWQYRRTFLINLAKEELSLGNKIEHWTNALVWAEDNPVISTGEQKNKWRSFIGWPGEIILPEERAALSLRQYLGIGFFSSYNPFPAYLSSNLEKVNNHLNEDAEGTNLISIVSQITIPSLLIWGRYDDLIAPEEGKEVFTQFGTEDSHKFYKLLPNSSHEPYISDPENFKKEVIEFVTKY